MFILIIKRYGMYTGTYTINNIPQAHPIAFKYK